jgi:5-methyltetrahydropteroyltriglutamate--homocysteine methyltransferase
MHLCRGNNQGMWMSEGGYEQIAAPVFRRATRFHAFMLEYDDHRSGSFEPLTEVPEDKTVGLGLISTKSEPLESAAAIMARIDEASRYLSRQRLALCTACGFASIAHGTPITPSAQRAKLALIADVARRAWG